MPSSPMTAPVRNGQPASWLPSSPGRSLPSLDDDNNSTDDDEFDMPLLQRNPLTYFLTPPTPMEEDMELDFDFDAGIEDSNNPKEIVRSVSPSTLDGLKKYKAKKQQHSHNSNECAIIDDEDEADDDDKEDYIRFRPSKSLPLGVPDFGSDRPRATNSRTKLTEALLSPTEFHVGSPRGRPAKRFAPLRHRPPFRQHARARSLSLQRRHSWREPSPDVWCIEEEPEKETMSELGMSTEHLDMMDVDTQSVDDAGHRGKMAQPIDIAAAKPKKKVRFILPV